MSQPARNGTRSWRRRIAVTVGLGYALGLLIAWAMLRFSHEGCSLCLVGLYAPPVGFLLPAPLVFFVTWRWASRRWLALQLASAVFALFGLLGLRLGPGHDTQAAQDPRDLRIVSYNIDTGSLGVPGIVSQVMKLYPNLVLLQEADVTISTALHEAFVGWHVDQRGQFFIASRFPILDVREPAPLYYRLGESGSPKQGEGGAHFVAYTLDTTLGPIDVLNVHTTSPREGLEDIRGRGFLYEIRHGHILHGFDAGTLTFNAYRRRRQVENLANVARASSHPVLIAGDFNLPALSHVVPDSLGDFDDAFARVGRGFGYTYPSKLPFLRIDRIFTGHGLRAVDFRVGDTRASDHLCVSAVITAADR